MVQTQWGNLPAIAAMVLGTLLMPATAHPQDVNQSRISDVPPSIRVVAFNVLGLRGFPLEKGAPIHFSTPSPELVRELAERLLQWDADIILLQEAPPKEVVKELADLCGMHFVFFPTRAKPSPDWPFGFPGALLTKWPLQDAAAWAGESGEVGDDLFQRHWGEATVRIGNHPLRVSGLHLCADWGGVFRESTRLAELEILLRKTRADLIAGDFNMLPESAPWHRLQESGWRDGWLEAEAQGGGLTSDSRNPRNRIDYFWLAPDSPWRFQNAQVLENIRVTVGQDTVFLSDHLPILAELVLQPATN